MSAKPHPNTVAFMKSPEFWDLFGLAMCNEKNRARMGRGFQNPGGANNGGGARVPSTRSQHTLRVPPPRHSQH